MDEDILDILNMGFIPKVKNVTLEIKDDKVEQFLSVFDLESLKRLYITQIENENYEACSIIQKLIKEKEN